MILLDTNLVSEPWRFKPDPPVVAWFDAQAVETLYLLVVTVAELRFGIAAMPAVRRRVVLHGRVEGALLPLFAGRILPFDLDASRTYAALMSKTKIAGLAIAVADGYVAAIAAAWGFGVASRDVGPLVAAGVAFINPWAAVT
jgi:predicted nucleic acid-binding protein